MSFGLPLDDLDGEVGALIDVDGLDQGLVGVILRLADDEVEAAGDGGDRGHRQLFSF